MHGVTRDTRLTVIGRRGRIRSTTDRVRARKSTNRRWSDSSEGGKTENRRAVTEKCATREPSLGKTSAHFRRRDPARSSAPALSPVERFDSRLRLIARASTTSIHVKLEEPVTDRLRASRAFPTARCSTPRYGESDLRRRAKRGENAGVDHGPAGGGRGGDAETTRRGRERRDERADGQCVPRLSRALDAPFPGPLPALFRGSGWRARKKNAIAPRPPPRRSTPPDPRAATPRSPRFRSGEVRGRRQGWKKEKGGARIARRAPTAASRHHGCPSWTLARERSILPAVPSRAARDPTSPAPPIAGGPQASGARGQIERTREARWG